MRKLEMLGWVLCIVGLTSCASSGGGKPRMATMLREATGQNGRACVRLADIRSYGVLKHDVVSINAFNGYYLATVLPGCLDLQSSIGALFRGSFGEVCGGAMNRIVTDDDQCLINQVFEFEDRDEAFAIFDSILERRDE